MYAEPPRIDYPFENECQPSVLISHRLAVSLAWWHALTRTQRQNRERELIAATRALFDERGVQDAPIEEIAKSVGIARGLIYRQFSSKEELYVATVADYLTELVGMLDEAEASAGDDPVDRLERMAYAYAGSASVTQRFSTPRSRSCAVPPAS